MKVHKMWTLAFDTTTNFCSVILMKDNNVCSVFSSEMTFGQSEVLLPQIETIFKNNSLSFQDLALLCVCTGPGSFTGVRSSISAARAFGLSSKNLTLCGINAFDVYASTLEAHQRSEYTAVIIETKREDFYYACYDKNLRKIIPPKTAFYNDIIRDLKGHNITLVGDGIQRFLSRKNDLHIHEACFDTHPNIKTLALLGIDRFNEKTTDYPKPLYLKAADVCIK